MGEMNKFLTVGQDFFPILRVTLKGSGEGGTDYTRWMQQFCDIFDKKVDACHMILGDNPAGWGLY